MKWCVKLAGYKNWKFIPWGECSDLGVLVGDEVEEEVVVEAETWEDAVVKAIEVFEGKGYYFEEVVWFARLEVEDTC